MKRVLVFCIFFMTFFNVKSQDDVREKFLSLQPTGYVNDYQNLFTPEQKDTLEKMMSDYEKKTSIEFTFVAYYIDNADYDQELVRELAEKWGVGKSNLNNGFMMFLSYSEEPGKSNYFNATGYGLEPFLPDGKLNNIEYRVLLPLLKDGKIYEGYKEYILACQNELGADGYDMLVENKRISDEKQKALAKKIKYWSLRIISLLFFVFGIFYITSLIYKKREKYLQLKKEVVNKIKSMNELKNSLSSIPEFTILEYDKLPVTDESKLTKKYINYEYLASINNVYHLLLDHKATINTINNTLKSISKSKYEINTYLLDKYPYCEKFIKDELNNILLNINVNESNEYTKKRMNYLLGVQNSLDRKIKTFTTKISKINAIISDNKNIEIKIKGLHYSYSEYIRKKNILASVKIGNRVFNNINFSENIEKIKSNIIKSNDFLINNNLESALFYYGNYVTSIAVLNNSFSSVDLLFDKYNKSENYLKLNESKIDKLISDIDKKINKSGVSYSRKSKYENIKSNINKYKKTLNNDIIEAATLLPVIITSLTSLLSSIKSDISYSSYSSSNSSYSRSGGYSSGGGSSFGGFGGGSFGGGGSGGRF